MTFYMMFLYCLDFTLQVSFIFVPWVGRGTNVKKINEEKLADQCESRLVFLMSPYHPLQGLIKGMG